MARIFLLDAHDLPSRRRQLEGAATAAQQKALGDKLQLLALLHPASLRVLEEMVDDTIRRLNE